MGLPFGTKFCAATVRWSMMTSRGRDAFQHPLDVPSLSGVRADDGRLQVSGDAV